MVTRKGKGYAPAEADPIKWHGPGPFDPASGVIFKEKASGPTYSQIFGQWLCDMAEHDPRIVGITPAMREGSGLVEFSKRFPERYFDVAIAEQHAVTFAAGLACEGLQPVVAIYSTFLQRAYDQLIHDVALQNLPVVFAIDRAGLVGGDGATHQGSFDLSYLRCIPNLVVMAPADENECRQMLYTASQLDQPAAVRYPRGQGPGVAIEATMRALPVGKAQIRREGAAGSRILAVRRDGADRASASPSSSTRRVVNMRFVKPLDEELIAAHRGHASRARHGRGERRRRRRRLARSSNCLAANGHAMPTLTSRHSRSLHRARLARGLPRRSRASTAQRSKARSSAGGTRGSGWQSAVSSPCGGLALYWARPNKPRSARRFCTPNHGDTSFQRSAPRRVLDRGRAGPRRYPPAADQPGRHQGHLPPGAREGPLERRAAHHRQLQHVRGPAAQLQGHAHVALRRDPAPDEREISVESFRDMLAEMTEQLEAEAGHIEMAFPYFVMKKAPVSGVESLMDYQATLIGELHDGKPELWLKVVVPVTSLCPCSKKISDYGAHNQRSHVTIKAQLSTATCGSRS